MFYEIRETRTNEVLIDKLTESEVSEVYNFYNTIMGIDVYVVRCEVVTSTCRKHHSREKEYKTIYIQYMAELQDMGNLI